MSDSEDEVQDWTRLQPARGATQSVLKRGEKDFAPDGTSSQQNTLAHSRDTMYRALVADPHHGKTMLRGVWDSEMRMCRIDQQRGTFLNTVGVCKRGIFWLSPEETLYLVQRGSLFMVHGGSLQSVEAACALCLPFVDQAELLVYFYLKKLGYVVVRPTKRPAHHYHPQVSSRRPMMEILLGPWHTKFAHRRCYSSFDSLYRDLQFIETHTPIADPTGELTFYCWKPNTKYKKSDPPPPDFYIKVADARAGRMPSLDETNRLLQTIPEEIHGRSATARIKNGRRTLIIAVVDAGVVSFVKVMDTAFERSWS